MTDQIDPEGSALDPQSYKGGLKGCLEAILISAEEPLPAGQIAAVLGLDEPIVASALRDLEQDYEQQGSGIAVLSSARGWRIGSARPYDPIVSAFLRDRRTAGALSHAALEALAIIAYQQPVTRADVSRVRGVSSDSLVRSLILHGFVRESVPQDGSTARTLVTTDLFLEQLGISSLSELPPLAPFLPDQADPLEEADQQAERSRSDGPVLSRELGLDSSDPAGGDVTGDDGESGDSTAADANGDAAAEE